MELILAENVPQLGQTGDVVKVKDGYARNFLLPKNLAYPATAPNLKRIEQKKKKQQEQLDKEKQTAQAVADKLSKVSCTINVEVNDKEKLYGAVTEAEIVKVIADEGFNFDKKDIIIEKPIEELGIFEVGVKLHPQVIAKIRLWVTKK